MSSAGCRRRSHVARRPVHASLVLMRDGREVAEWPLPTDNSTEVDLSVVDGLVRLQLAARRFGCSIRVRDACSDLRGLLELTGLTEVLAPGSDLVVEVLGQAEGLEERGVEERVERGDPIA
jgi:hypothetical protein